ncbi:MAG: hypothetical protein AAF581_12795 [Planctomycetota bacterium]
MDRSSSVAMRRTESSPVARVSSQLQKPVPGEQGNVPGEWPLISDLRALMGRLRRVQGLGGRLGGVELSPQMRDAARSLKLVGNEMLVLAPDRKGGLT